MDQAQAPLLDAIQDYRKHDRYGFTPPGHRQGRAVDGRVAEVLGGQPFTDDMLASGGLDDRLSRNKYLLHAEQLMAEAVGAEDAFFSTLAARCRLRRRCLPWPATIPAACC